MKNYFGIHEKVNCGDCNGINDISLIVCDYCGANFHTTASGKILAVREKFDSLLAQGEFQAANDLIAGQTDVSYPILMFRLIIAEFNSILLNDPAIKADKYRKHLDQLGELIDISEDYFKGYVQYVYNILPFDNVELAADDYRSIVGHYVIERYDTKELLTEAFQLQYASTALDAPMLKEIKFYLNPANQMNVESFQTKKKYLLNIFKQAIDSL